MRSSSIRRLRSGLIAWRRESSFAAPARPSCTTLDASIPQALSGFRLLTAIEQHRVCRSLYCPIAPLVNYHGVQGGNNLNFSRLPCFRNLHTFINALNAWQPEE